MQVLIVLAVLGALALSDVARQEALADPHWRVAATLIAVALPIAVGWWLSRLTARRLQLALANRARTLRNYRRLRNFHTALWLAAAAVVLTLLDWPRLVRFNLGLDGWVLVDELLVVAPVLLPLICSWAAFFEVDWALREPAGGQVFAATDQLPPLPPRWRYVVFQMRTVIGIALAPLALLLATQDIAKLLAPDFMAGPHAWTVLLLPLGALVLGFPILLRFVWRTEPLPPGPLRTRLEAAAERFNLRVREILVWQTDGLLLNAAVAGFVPSLRYIFLTDALLENMTDDEIEAVFGHEVGHIRHRHVLLRALVLLVPVSLWSLLQGTLPNVAEWGVSAEAAGWTTMALAGLTGVALLGLYIAAVFGFCSRRFERQADLFGCRVASATLPVTGDTGSTGLSLAGIQTFVQALEKLAVLNGCSRRAPSWQHSSIALRVAYLEDVARDPAFEARCHRQVRFLGGLLVAVVLLGFIAPLVQSLVLAG